MTRKVVLLAATVLLAAACGGGSELGNGSAAGSLAYSLTGDVVLDYNADMDVNITTDFGDSFQAFDPSAPSRMDMNMAMGFDTRYQVGPGEESGTYRVSMSLENLELHNGSVSVGTESVDIADLPQSQIDTMLKSQVAEVEWVIDEQGEILSLEFGDQAIDVGGMMSGMSMGGNSGQMFGPELPDGEVQIGDTWTTSTVQELPGMDPIETEQTHEIVRAEERNGVDTWVIRTETSVDGYTLTWDTVMALAGELGGLGAVGLDAAMPAGFDMVMRASPMGGTTLTWFDPVGGVTVAQDTTMNLAMNMEMSGLPDTGGRTFTMKLGGYTDLLMELAP
jgi:hypothetical protein